MKKILLCFSVMALFATGFAGCSQQKQWNHQQRQTMREALNTYREMVYLNDLNDAEFVLFSDNVSGTLEGQYPAYTSFIEMPGMSDTVNMVVVTTIATELNADASNMRHIYPYPWLTAEGILPAGLDHSQQKSFYNCFASKVNAAGWTAAQFFNAVLNGTADSSMLRTMMTQCANNLFSWTVTEVEVVETTN